MRGGRIWRQTQSKGYTYTNPPPDQHLTHARRLTTVIFFSNKFSTGFTLSAILHGVYFAEHCLSPSYRRS